MLEGSACTIFIWASTGLIVEDSSDELVDADGERFLIFDVGSQVINQLARRILSAGYDCLIGPTQSNDWEIPALCQTMHEVQSALEAFVDEMKETGSDRYPLMLWFLPRKNGIHARDVLARFLSDPLSFAPWRQVLHAGIVAVTIENDQFRISADCDLFSQTYQWIRESLAAPFPRLPVRWID